VVHERGRGEVAQRWGSILVAVAVVFIAAWMTVEGLNPRPIKKDTADAAATGESAVADAASASAPAASTSAGAAPDDGGLFLPSLSFGDAGPMPSGAPRHVKIGVVLVTFAGAEGAPATARSKHDAQTIAERLGQDARSDFHQAVRDGDPGSSDDIGRLPRGVLDPRTEIAVFALATGEVSEVLETPKGYWIVKRIE
jgi:hypothetical protein